jgi:glucose-6-phosphate 1-dehydrogenase
VRDELDRAASGAHPGDGHGASPDAVREDVLSEDPLHGVGYEAVDEVGYDEEGDGAAAARRAAVAPSPFAPGRPDPCALVIFGVTGDLSHRKLVPALYDLACHDVLPDEFTIVGYGRKPLDDAVFREQMLQAIDDHYDEEQIDEALCQRVLRSPRYVRGEFNDPDGFRRLAGLLADLDAEGGTRGNRMFYLATPPGQFPVIVRQLEQAGLARRGAYDREHAAGEPVAGWTRVVIEKPFGSDTRTAGELNRIVGSAFDERQVYRIDHYLAKETVQNLLVLRFANTLFEPVWNRRFIDHVQITAAETLGVEHRGPYYDRAGALRDMIQPHLVELFALTAMEPPVAFGAGDVGDEKLKLLRAVRTIPPDKVDLFAARGQYVRGMIGDETARAYREEEEVAPDSLTETYAALKLLVDNWRWQGVPFYLRTGKRLKRRVTEITIQFKRPPVLLFREAAGTAPKPDQLVLRVQPDEGFSLHIQSKVPGRELELGLQEVEMDYHYGSSLRELPFSAYETVLVDAMEGDMTLFKRGDQVEQAWRIVEPVLEAWKRRPALDIPIYEAGAWGPEAADNLVARDGNIWRRP